MTPQSNLIRLLEASRDRAQDLLNNPRMDEYSKRQARMFVASMNEQLEIVRAGIEREMGRYE